MLDPVGFNTWGDFIPTLVLKATLMLAKPARPTTLGGAGLVGVKHAKMDVHAV